uniref:Cyclin-like domain-containing protein n=1 Tax=Heliothis virescens TaxID=7102 RepID=A0A2A4JSA3_HELVI
MLEDKIKCHTQSTDPCLYILRFSSQLQFADKSHEVSMTALRLVQRMKRDSIHSGRRPSGICGAALLIAARLHEFNRTPADVVRIVKVHESTLRKRLLEFGDTPSSALTLEEFMTVDLEEEQDPPAFRAARKRDKERLQKLMEEEDGERELTDLQKEIEHQLEKDSNRRRKVAAVIGTSTAVLGIDETSQEDAEASRFAAEDALDRIGEIAQDVQCKEDGPSISERPKQEKGLGPDLAVIGLGGPSSEDKTDKFVRPEPKQKDLHNADELILDQKDEEYINSLIMTEEEVRHKAMLWNKINAGYLKEQKIKEELRAREREENKDKKKKLRGSYKKRTPCNAATAGEAIEKMIAEKKISSKINYDILKSLDHPGGTVPPATPKQTVVVESKQATPSAPVPASPVPRKRKKKNPPAASPAPRTPATPAPPTPQPVVDIADDYEDEMEPDPVEAGDELSLAAMLQNGQDDDYYDYEEY